MSFWQLDTWKKLFGGTPTNATANATGDLSQQVRYIANQFPIGGTLIDYQVFTASGTWNKPAGARVVIFYMWGAGGGGGSGAVWVPRVTSADNAHGGAGGPFYMYRAVADWLPSTVTVTVGAGGTGGAAVTVPAGQTSTLPGNGGASGGVSRIVVSGVNVGLSSGGAGGPRADTPTYTPYGSGYQILARRHAYEASFPYPLDYSWHGAFYTDTNLTYAQHSGAGGGHTEGGASVLGGGGGGAGGRSDSGSFAGGDMGGGRCAGNGTPIYYGGNGGSYASDNAHATAGANGTIPGQGGGGGGAHHRSNVGTGGNAGGGGVGGLFSGGGGGGTSGSTVSPLNLNYLSGAGGSGGNGLVIVETYG